MDKKELKTLVESIAQEMRSVGIPVSTNIEEVEINPRTKRRLGCCKRRKNIVGKEFFTIEISRYALKCEKRQLCSIIAHELLHTCKGCFNHGKKWKILGKTVEDRLGYSITRTVDYENLGLENPADSEKTKYVIVCRECGQKIERKRKCPLVKNIGKYRCGKCGGILKLEGKSTTSCR